MSDPERPYRTPHERLIETNGTGLEIWPQGDKTKAVTVKTSGESWQEGDDLNWEDTGDDHDV